MVRLTNLLLLVAALSGGYFAWRASAQQATLRAEYEQLAVRVGRVTIEDESKFQLLALDTGQPLHFAWQLYVPAGVHVEWRMKMQGTDSTSTFYMFDAYRELVRVRFRKIDGLWCMWRNNRAGSSYTAGLGEELDRMLDHADRLRIEQLATDGPLVLDETKVHTLLRISDPSAASDSGNSQDPPVITLQFGTREAWEKSEATDDDNQ